MVQAFRANADVVVDMTELGYADTSLMMDLAMLSNRLRLRGRTLLLRGGAPQIMHLIETVGLHRLPGVRMAEADAVPPDPPSVVMH